MSMYVIQVATGQEKTIRDALLDKCIPAYVPEENRWIRSGGTWKQKNYVAFRSYVFLIVRDVRRSYYDVKRIPDVYRWLELHTGRATPLLEGEEAMIREMCGDEPMDSVVAQDGKTLIPVSGLLRTYYDRGSTIVYDLHARRAIVGNPLTLLPNHVLTLSFRLLK
ncbi:MAG: transcription termination/antitermination NusG family protein [Ethanoligenens sp.]